MSARSPRYCPENKPDHAQRDVSEGRLPDRRRDRAVGKATTSQLLIIPSSILPCIEVAHNYSIQYHRCAPRA
ncbi:hypothetical protein J1614_000307 [Plenodomus biglobosus]|nr:hypothetical protein J1614_000307 [Plenodomus biglobosus]